MVDSALTLVEKAHMLRWMQEVTADETRFARVNYILGGLMPAGVIAMFVVII